MILQVHLNPAFLETWLGCKVANSCGNFSADSGKFFWPPMVLTKTIKVASLDSSMQIATNCTHGKNQLMMRTRDLCRRQPYVWVSLFISDGHWIPVIRVVLNNPVYLLMVPHGLEILHFVKACLPSTIQKVHGSDAPRAIKQLSDETIRNSLSWTLRGLPLFFVLTLLRRDLRLRPSPNSLRDLTPKNTKNMFSQGFFHSIILISFVSILEKL